MRIPGMPPGMDIKKLMKDVEEIEAERVIIEGPRRLVIEHPKVMRMSVMGQDTFQVIGTAKEEKEQTEELFTDDDVKLVMEQTGVDEEEVKEVLIENKGDIAKTILNLKK